jgi:hypothetical protein
MNVEEIVFGKKTVDSLSQPGSQAKQRPKGVGARTEVRDGAQVFK